MTDPNTTAGGFLPPRVLPPGTVDCPGCDADPCCPVCGGAGHVVSAVATAYDAHPYLVYVEAYSDRHDGHRLVIVPERELRKLADDEGDWIVLGAVPHRGLLVGRQAPGVVIASYLAAPVRFVGAPEFPFVAGGAR